MTSGVHGQMSLKEGLKKNSATVVHEIEKQKAVKVEREAETRDRPTATV